MRSRIRSVPFPRSAVVVWVAVVGPAFAMCDPSDLRALPRGQESDLQERFVVVGGATVRAVCTEGETRVVLLHDEGASSDSWRSVLERLNGRVGACAYDRRGSGQSDSAPADRGWYELLDELRLVHESLGARRPYVLVGHGLGGLYARLFTSDRPGDVGGLVLVEPAHEDMLRRSRTGMPAEEWRSWRERRTAPNADGVTEVLVAERARRGRLPQVPVTVLTAGRRQDGDGWDGRFLNEAARRVHASILRGLRQGRHIPATRSGHWIHQDEPELVVEAVLRIVRAASAVERQSRRGK
ncbi:MAG: alpha/beta hydrolase [Gemmatimonadota bacterium]|nr:alpha/beta hydrolase [Gemmatimonadota bacterium]